MSLSVRVEGKVYQFTSKSAEEALRRVLSREGVRRVDPGHLEVWRERGREDAKRRPYRSSYASRDWPA